MSRYRFIAPRLTGRCLDIGCGRGYGFEYLRPNCTACTGLDVSEIFLEEARVQYPDITFVHQNAEQLPFADQQFESVTSFEVIEHIQDDRSFLREIARVAAPGALVAISTPNRLIASGNRCEPLNKFHVREYVADEFRKLLTDIFINVELYGQFERKPTRTARGFTGSLLSRIPVGVKYMIPFYVQDMFSVMLRSPLRFEDCLFVRDDFDQAHTLFAVGRVRA